MRNSGRSLLGQRRNHHGLNIGNRSGVYNNFFNIATTIITNCTLNTTIWIRTGIILFIIIFISLQINYLSLQNITPIYLTSSNNINNANTNSNIATNIIRGKSSKNITTQMHDFQSIVNPTSTNSTFKIPLSLWKIKQIIAHYNQQQTVYNEDVFEPLQNDSIVIIIQIHNRINYLRQLISSLGQARDISKSLIVFSHDYYDEEINTLIQNVTFCKVIQIFYPYSIQTHPHEFPGEDPNDCSRNINKEQANLTNCNNALYPDLYGHYREANFTQTKHHWWWKLNRVFNQLNVTKNHTGLVVFLEEDHYVSEDFLYLLKLMETTTNTSCRRCNILSLGTYLKTVNYNGDWKKVEITQWIGSKHNMGMAFNRSTWMKIKKCAKHFCTYDDYNWDWSLQYLSQNCSNVDPLYVMVARGPRVFHIGECGVHHKKKNCESTRMVLKVKEILKAAKSYLYPNSLISTHTKPTKKIKLHNGNGGWGDKRDQNLCLSISST